MQLELVESQAYKKSINQQQFTSTHLQSTFLQNSVRLEQNPEVYHTFFHNQPWVKYSHDISKLKKISHEAPPSISSRPYVIVDYKVHEGKPISEEQMRRLLNQKKMTQNQIITYGISENTNLKLQEAPVRQKIEIQTENKKIGFCWCCAPVGEKNNEESYLVKNYE